MDVGTWQVSPDAVPSHTLCNPHNTNVRGVDLQLGYLTSVSRVSRIRVVPVVSEIPTCQSS